LPAINSKIKIGGHHNERNKFEGLLPILYNRYDCEVSDEVADLLYEYKLSEAAQRHRRGYDAAKLPAAYGIPLSCADRIMSGRVANTA